MSIDTGMYIAHTYRRIDMNNMHLYKHNSVYNNMIEEYSLMPITLSLNRGQIEIGTDQER